ncbi:PIG-L family deacetylase [Phytohabitans sp. LJ34]|uniref:PIG-L family deacetylase n=1 Tax=Phytohabitans sp. LJ34 TaxID=3452217 RepID=UPI003F89C354
MGLTLMAVHAHPDDEVISTGGILARYAAEGVRTVLVTCTNGEQGDGPGGIKPDQDGHDEAEVVRLRLEELQTSAGHLGIDHVELLGYRDSGMPGWEANNHPEAFSNIPVADAAAPLAALMRRYRPDVVVTYDENGGYGHPDHIQAHRIAVEASRTTGIPRKFYHTAIPRGALRELFEHMRDAGIELGFEPPEDFGIPDDEVSTRVDVSPYAEGKCKALEAHTSQGENMFFLFLPREIQHLVFAKEYFILQHGDVHPSGGEDDLFAGLR